MNVPPADGPIETAYAAVGVEIAKALHGAGFLPSADALAIDPPDTFEPNGEETTLITAAAWLKGETQPGRARMGSGRCRYTVDRGARLELAAAGPDETLWRGALERALTAVAPLADADPTCGGACERWALTLQEDDGMVAGNKAFLTFLIRVRSADPLGRTA